MKKIKLLHLSLLASLAILSTGCSLENPFGVGYEHSACESSSNFGVCGSPEDVYKYRDKIRETQNEYLKSGYEDELFFGITNDGSILVKEGRTDKWEQYSNSKIEKEIKTLLKENEDKKAENNSVNKVNGFINYNKVDIPATEGTDLSIKYQSQGRIIQTRTNIGDMIRDNGLVQKVWVAPVVDIKGDLISAHEIFVVVKDPSWIVGEETPSNTKANMKNIPTPISTEMMKKQDQIDTHEENVIQHFNTNNEGGLIEEIQNDPRQLSEEERKNLNQIENFIKE